MFSLLLPVENTNIPHGQSETSEGYWMFSELHNVSVASQGSDSEMCFALQLKIFASWVTTKIISPSEHFTAKKNYNKIILKKIIIDENFYLNISLY